MNKINKKGFTLVELIAVLIIISIITTITLVAVSKYRKDALEREKTALRQTVVAAFQNYRVKNTLEKESAVKISLLKFDSRLSYKEDFCEDDIKNVVYYTKKGDHDSTSSLEEVFCVTFYCNDKLIIDDATTNDLYCDAVSPYEDYNETEGVNAPELVTGMTPIKWSGSAWVDTTSNDADWYSYTTIDKKWANARTADGSMWVWIPRYVYKISSSWHTKAAAGGTIDVQFSMDTDDTRGGTVTLNTATTASASNNTWTNHPAFTFGTTELSGIWVAKFEASPPSSSTCYTSPGTANCNVTTIVPKSVPSVASWRSIYLSTGFTVVRNMESNTSYGWSGTGSGIDTHMMKNSEWGATVYLAQSNYGKNAEVWINNSSTSITGCAGDTASDAAFSGCEYAYTTSNGQQASTTGNTSGVYDMSGGSYEYVSAYLNNSTANLTTYGASLFNADSKYKNIYSVGTSDTAANNYVAIANSKGESIYETSSSGGSSSASWRGDNALYIYDIYPFLIRGGFNGTTTYAGMFGFNINNGNSTVVNNITFRPVLLVQSGL